MVQKKPVESDVSSKFSKLMRRHFGRGPESVYVTVKGPFFTAYLQGFLHPMEKVLLKQKENERILSTRGLMIDELEQDMRKEVFEMTSLRVNTFQSDWDLDRESGVIIGILEESIHDSLDWPVHIERQKLIDEFCRASALAEKPPKETNVYWLNNRTVLAERHGILTRVEKQLVKDGYDRELVLSKRPVEKEALAEVDLEKVLNQQIKETFVDWDLSKDIGYIVLILDI
ncbi:Na-translocating system protein MpsC family protein [Alkalicoccus chagannorensis]|uniref:Na-translocating system protein MpsC family protein n=1 Tax=Alkalicoccus chagannorensis TaxID=427072 RepID=UPI000412B7B2|nr:Na-translocating system protein MpsC family protein [Alkalicoccus chagannorensis]